MSNGRVYDVIVPPEVVHLIHLVEQDVLIVGYEIIQYCLDHLVFVTVHRHFLDHS